MNSDTILIRQIHPSFVQNGRVGSNAFCPTPKDDGKLSTYDGDMIDVESAWSHYTNDLGHQSTGSLGISKGECESLNLTLLADPEPFPEHVLIVFTAFGKGVIKKKSKQLKNIAVQRGWLFEA